MPSLPKIQGLKFKKRNHGKQQHCTKNPSRMSKRENFFSEIQIVTIGSILLYYCCF